MGELKTAVLLGIGAGILGTLVMDAVNFLAARVGALLQIDHRMIGRVGYGWVRGRFVYPTPADLKPVPAELMWGFGTHYVIGIVFGVAFFGGWELLIGGPASAMWAVIFGVFTTVAAYFFLFPSIGLGLFGRRSPKGLKLPISSLTNHLFYGLGLALAIILAG